MKAFISKITVSFLLLLSGFLHAQAPQKMSYQSVIRNSEGELVVSTPIGVKVSILQGSVSGTAVYTEIHSATTNENGLCSIEIGGGVVESGTFSGINWGLGTYFIKTETDPAGGTNYTISGTSQLLSVPYALYSGNSSNQGKPTIFLTGNITNEQAATKIAAEFGVHTENIYISNTTALTTVDLSSLGDFTLVSLKIKNNDALTTVNLDGITTVFSDISVTNNPQITGLAFSSLAKGPEILKIENNVAMTTLSFPVLTEMYPNSVIDLHCPAVTSLEFPVLATVYDFQIYAIGNVSTLGFPALAKAHDLNFSSLYTVTDLQLPALTEVFGIKVSGCNALVTFSANNLLQAQLIEFQENDNLTNLELNTMSSVDSLNLFRLANLTTVNFPSLSSCKTVYIDQTVITTLNFPALAVCGTINVNNTPTFSAIDLSSLSSSGVSAGSYRLTGSLPSSAVNEVLSIMANVTPSSGKSIDLAQNPPAPPTGQGLIDKQALIDAGNNVFTD